MLPKLSYLSSGQINFFDNNAKLKTNSSKTMKKNTTTITNTNTNTNKTINLNGNLIIKSQADENAFLINNNTNNNSNDSNQSSNQKLPEQDFKNSKDNLESFYFNTNESDDLYDNSNIIHNNLNIDNNQKRNLFILDKYSLKQKEFYYNNIASKNNNNTSLLDKQSLSSSTSSLSSFSTSQSSVSPTNHLHYHQLNNTNFDATTNQLSTTSLASQNLADKSLVFVSNKSINLENAINSSPLFRNNNNNNNNQKIFIKNSNLNKSNEKKEKEEENLNSVKYSSSLLIPFNSNNNNNSLLETKPVKLDNEELMNSNNLTNCTSSSNSSSSSCCSSNINNTTAKRQDKKTECQKNNQESKLSQSFSSPKNDKTKIITNNADLIKQKSLLKKNNSDCIKNNPNLRKSDNNIESLTASQFISYKYDLNNENEISIIQAKLESSHLALLAKEGLANIEKNGNTNLSKSNSNSLNNLLIVSRHGTVRGSVNHVKTSLKQIFKEPQITNPVTNAHLNITSNTTTLNSTKQNEKPFLHFYLARDYEEEEHLKIVIYTTSLQVVRISFDKCKRVKKILQNHCVRYEEKDLYKNKEFQRELKYRLNLSQVDVPHIFFNGKHIGNCDELELYSDQGVLNKLFKDLEKIKLRIYCCKCGGYRFVLCTLCNGSKRKFNNFTNLKCTHCNEDGLIRCDACLDQQE